MTKIKTPVTVEIKQKYGGDVRGMSGAMEVGYWTERYIVKDSNGIVIADCETITIAQSLADALNRTADIETKNEAIAVEHLEPTTAQAAWEFRVEKAKREKEQNDRHKTH